MLSFSSNPVFRPSVAFSISQTNSFEPATQKDLPMDEIPEPIEIGKNSRGRTITIPSSEQVVKSLYHPGKLPHEEDWGLCKRWMNEHIAQQRLQGETSCIFPSGRIISYDAFSQLPQFADTLEKFAVHQKLASLLQSDEFAQQYTRFLWDIQTEHWAENYRETPRLLAYLGIAAFLDERISDVELAVISSVSACFSDPKQESTIKILHASDAKKYITQTHGIEELYWILPIAESTAQKWAKKIDQCSHIERTSIVFSEQQGNMISLPLWTALAEIAAAEQGIQATFPSQHRLMFGYRQNIEDLIKGRPVAMINGVFAHPIVDRETGGIAVPMHDYIHIIIDYMHPFAEQSILLAQEILQQAPMQRPLVIKLLDRTFPVFAILCVIMMRHDRHVLSQEDHGDAWYLGILKELFNIIEHEKTEEDIAAIARILYGWLQKIESPHFRIFIEKLSNKNLELFTTPEALSFYYFHAYNKENDLSLFTDDTSISSWSSSDSDDTSISSWSSSDSDDTSVSSWSSSDSDIIENDFVIRVLKQIKQLHSSSIG